MIEPRNDRDAAGPPAHTEVPDDDPLSATARAERAALRAVRLAHGATFDQRVTGLLEAGRLATQADRASVWVDREGALECIADAPTPDRVGDRTTVDARWLEALAGRRSELTRDEESHPLRRARGFALDAPVLGADRRLGLLCLERADRDRPFDRVDRAALATCSDRMAVLLERHAYDCSAVQLRADETLLREAQSMASLGRLTSGVAHDFNNALTAILGGVQLIADGLPAESTLQPTTARTLDAIAFATDLTGQLLEFSRGETALARLVAIEDVVVRIRHLLRTLLGDRRRLQLDLEPSSPKVLAPPTRLAQVILNLVSNARDALPDGGNVTLATTNAGRSIVLRVTDDGIGMPQDVQQRIFEPLFTTKPAGEGCGLGLATVRHVIEEIGGTIAVDSEPGRGTTFEIRLPAGE